MNNECNRLRELYEKQHGAQSGHEQNGGFFADIESSSFPTAIRKPECLGVDASDVLKERSVKRKTGFQIYLKKLITAIPLRLIITVLVITCILMNVAFVIRNIDVVMNWLANIMVTVLFVYIMVKLLIGVMKGHL